MQLEMLRLIVDAGREMPVVLICLSALVVAGLSVFAVYRVSSAALRRKDSE